MKRHTAPEFVVAVFAMIVMVIAGIADAFKNAQNRAWWWFLVSVLSVAFFSFVLGFISIDAFNRRQRRRRELIKAQSLSKLTHKM